MAPRTTLDLHAIQSIAAAFALGSVHSFQAIAAGTINSNYRVVTERGSFAIRVNEGKTDADVRYEADLVAALADAGVPTPRPCTTRRGDVRHEHAGRLVSVFPWVAGGHVAADAIGPGHARAVGLALARLHRAGQQLGATFARAGIYTFAHICERAARLRNNPEPAVREARVTIDEELAWLRSRTTLRASGPTGVIHGDLFPDNVLFAKLAPATQNPAVTALLDFEQASTGSLIYDVAVCVNAWCVDEGDAATGVGHRIAEQRIVALLAGYRAGGAMTGAQLADLAPVLAVELRAAAVRFTVTRITDVYLSGSTRPDKDYRHFLRRVHSFRTFAHQELLTRACSGE